MTSNKTLRLACVFAVFLCASCSGGLSESELMSRAQMSFQQGETSTAFIDLKQILQQNPDNVQARFLLGQLYLADGDMVSAEKELAKAYSHGADPALVLPLLARVYLSLGKTAELEALPFDGLPPVAAAALLSSRGEARIERGDLAGAEMLVEEATDLAPDSPFVLLAKAKLAISDEEYQVAHELLSDVLEQDEAFVPALTLLGDLNRLEGNPKEAIAVYGKAIELQPRNGSLRFKRAFANIRIGSYDEAQQDASLLAKLLGEHPRVYYALGVIHHQKGEFKQALEALEIARRDEGRYPTSLFYTASCHLALGNQKQADQYASRFFSVAPNHLGGRKLLAYIRMNQDAYAQVIELLTPVVSVMNTDSFSLSMLASAHLRSGDAVRALELYEKVVMLNPESAAAHLDIGRALVAAGDTEKGITHFEKSIELNPDFEPAYEQLILTLLQAEKKDEAVGVAEAFRDANPEMAASHNMLGRTLIATNQHEAGEAAFEKASELDPGNPFASGKLAEIATSRKDLDTAKSYYETILKYHPDHLNALLGLASIDAMQQDEASMFERLERTMELHPSAVEPRLVMSRYYMLQGRPEKVEPLFSLLDESSRKNPDVLRILASAQIAQQQFTTAVDSMEKLIAAEPEKAANHVILARIYAGLGEPDKVKSHLQSALELDPQHLKARLALARMYMLEQDNKALKDHLEVLKELAPEHPDVLQLESNLATLEGDNEKAMMLSEQAMQASGKTSRMLIVVNQKENLGDYEGALMLQESWADEHPDDLQAQLLLARAYLRSGRIGDAIAQYENVLKLDKNNIIALNDLARLLKDTDKKQALEYAERARELQPKSASVLDTLALVLLENDQIAEADNTIDRAVQIAPDQTTLRYHQAMIKAAAGKPQEAIKILDHLLGGEVNFPGKEAAVALRQDLK